MAYKFSERGVNDFIADAYANPQLKKDTITAMRGSLSDFKAFVRKQFNLTQKQDETLDKFSESSASFLGERVACAFEENVDLKATFGPEPGSDKDFESKVTCGGKVTHYDDCQWKEEAYCECTFNILT